MLEANNPPVGTPESPVEAPAIPSPPSADSGGDPFHGKSREDVIKMYEEANTQVHQEQEGAKELKNFVGRVGMFFKVDEQTGTVDLNEDMVRQWAAARGIVPPVGQEAAQNDQGNNMAQAPQGNGAAVPPQEPALDDEQKAYVDKLVEDRIKAAIGQTVLPELETTRKGRHQNWIAATSQKYPDFSKWQTKVAEYMQKNNLQATSQQDLENAYIATKAIGGGFVDKAQHEKHVGDLVNTLQMLAPGAGQPALNDAEATNAQLLGLDQQNSKSVAANEELFGKQFLIND